MTCDALTLRRTALLLVLAATLGACGPSLSPLYRDYAVDERTEAPTGIDARLRAALAAAHWDVEGIGPGGLLMTEPRTVRNWGLYKIRVALEAGAVGDGYVRVFFHPYRVYVTGNRSKMPFLSRSLQLILLGDLNEALEAQGLQYAGTPIQRDRQARNNTSGGRLD